jgi:hypothetical protein
MFQTNRPLLRQSFSCWNWKCALMSAGARSLVYLAAMSRKGVKESLAVVLVEIAYVSLTAGIYAGMQQKALGLRSRLLGNLVITAGVPSLAQALDWLTHRLSGAPVTGKATLAVCFFSAVSALFHLHVMRQGAFLTGTGRSLIDDFRRMPVIVAQFVMRPVVLLRRLGELA